MPPAVGLSGAPLRFGAPLHFAPSPSNPLRAAAPQLVALPLGCSAIPEASPWGWLRFDGFHFASLHEDRLRCTRPNTRPLPWLHILLIPGHRASLSWRHPLLQSLHGVLPTAHDLLSVARFPNPAKTPLRSPPQPMPPAPPRTIPAGAFQIRQK